MVRYCPVCEDEFRQDVTVCSDCGGALILQGEGLGATRGAISEGADLASGGWRTAVDSLPVSSLLPIRTFDSLRDLEPALAAFADVQLPSRVLVQNGRYILLVHPDTLADAQTALQAADGDPTLETDPTFDASVGRYSNCPACDTRLPEDNNGTCPECGLELSAPTGSAAVPEAE